MVQDILKSSTISIINQASSLTTYPVRNLNLALAVDWLAPQFYFFKMPQPSYQKILWKTACGRLD